MAIFTVDLMTLSNQKFSAQRKISFELTRNSLPDPQIAVLNQLFEAQVERTPDAIALISERQTLTYQQLNQQANQLAHYLHRQGVIPDTVVGLFLERSPDMVVAMLGILKAGGAYLPLDPDHPTERTASILTEAEVSLILSSSHFSDQLPQQNGQVIYLDSDQKTISHCPATNLGYEIHPEHLAYVIYTSGSTGKPKGVMIPHAGICNQLYWRQSTFPLTPSDRVLQNISFSFDPSVWQIFWPLSWGVQLVLPKPGGHRDIAYLVNLIVEKNISILALVPAMLRTFLEQKGSDQCTSLRHVFCGGEALPIVLQQRFLDSFSETTQLHNVYGPTEASIDATYWTCHPGEEAKIAPIGRPITNAEVYILDEHLQAVTPGDSGELYLGGCGLARGYLRQPELTRERFIPHPYNAEAKTRLYKTGDLVRCRPDGNLEFLGRIDSQVKVRGFRIELQEIEAVLSQHQQVAHCAVLARTDSAGDRYLVAYVLPHGQQLLTSREIRQFLQESLPEYMVPSYFVILAELPLNANGKLDRQALPEPELNRQTLELKIDFVAPKDSLELAIAKIWEEDLQMQPIGVRDNFFELGGNSLRAASMLAQIEDVFNQQVPLGAFFQAPTIENLAGYLNGTLEEQPRQSLVLIQPHGSRPPLFCVHTRSGSVVDYYPLLRYLDPEQPVYGFQARGLDGDTPPDTHVEDMARAYIQEMRSVQPAGPYFLCGYSFGGLVAYEMACQLARQGEDIGLLVLIDTYCLSRPWFTPRLSPSYLAEEFNRKAHRALDILYGVFVRPQMTPQLATPEPIWVTMHAIFEQATKSYRLPKYPHRVALIKAAQFPDDGKFMAKRMDDSLGWCSVVTGELMVYPVPGHHFNMLLEPHVRGVAVQLQQCLQQQPLS